MRDEDDRVRIGGEIRLEPVARLEIEMVGRLVEQQQIGLAEQELGQREPHLPAARQVIGELVEVGELEAEAAQHGRDLQLEVIAVGDAEALLQLAVAVQQRVVLARPARGSSPSRCSRSCISAFMSSSGLSARLASSTTDAAAVRRGRPAAGSRSVSALGLQDLRRCPARRARPACAAASSCRRRSGRTGRRDRDRRPARSRDRAARARRSPL